MSGYILHAQDLAAGYDGAPVLREVDLVLRPGEILTLVGPNGAGKSTLLRTLARQLEPVSGAVFLDGAPLARIAENEFARTVSILLTERIRGEWMTCADVVSSGRYPYTGRLGILSEQDLKKTAEAMELVSVTELRDRPFSRVSDGQRQRVMLARAICQEPKVLVMDEPTSYLDVRYQLELLGLMRRLAAERGIAILASMHELELARRVSDRVLCVRNGAVDRVGTPEEVLTDEYVERLYDLPPGSYREYLAPRVRRVGGTGSAFFQNRDCESFPCHRGVPEEEFNCLFCYCPLYALGPRCGGGFTYTDSGAKSCVNCDFPHRRENYSAVLARYPELKKLAEERHGL